MFAFPLNPRSIWWGDLEFNGEVFRIVEENRFDWGRKKEVLGVNSGDLEIG